MIPVVQIARVSTDEQAAGDRAGLSRQAESCRVACGRYDLHVVRSLQLVDVPGDRVADTSEWAEVVALLRDGRARGVVADSVDRLLRADRFDFRVFRDLHETGARIWTPDGVRDPRDGNDSLLLTLLATLAGREKREIVRRAHAGKERRRAAGEWVVPRAWLPLGVDYDRNAPANRWSYTPDVARVQEWFRRFAAGTVSIRQLAAEAGIGTTAMANRLRNDLYRGWLVITHRQAGASYASRDGRQSAKRSIPRAPEDVISVQVLDPPAVDDALWQRVQHELQRTRRVYNSTRQTRDDRYPWTWRGMLVCDSCGAGLDVRGSSRPGTRSDPRYWCSAAWRGNGCDAGSALARHVDAAVVEAVAATLAHPELVERALDAYLTELGSPATRTQADAADQRVRQIEAKRRRLLDLYLDDAWTRADLDARRQQLDDELAAARADVVRLRPGVAVAPDDRVALATQIAEALVDFGDAAPASQRALLQALGARIVVRKPPRRHALTITRIDVDAPLLAAGATGYVSVHVA